MADDAPKLPLRWQKAEVIAKVAAGVAIPVLLALLTLTQRSSERTESRWRDSVQTADVRHRDSVVAAQRHWDRAVGLIDRFTSPNETERLIALAVLRGSSGAIMDDFLAVVRGLALNDPDPTVRAEAADVLNREIQQGLAMSAPPDTVDGESRPLTAERRDSIQATVSAAVTPQSLGAVSGASVLWVDDNPQNNASIARSLRGLGIRVQTARSTNDALRAMDVAGYDAIVTDMGRPEGGLAGYTLLDSVRARGASTPVIVYSRSNDLVAHDQQVRDAGGFGQVETPEALLAALRAVLSR